MEWQPIDTAPRGGKWILVYEGGAINTKYSRCDVARWLPKGPYSDSKGPGWYNGAAVLLQPPTHWMPLPEPPK